MREIKFRAWHRSAGVMSRVFDLFGYGNIQREMDLNSCDVMQFTGLKDSEGNEIYEGDIVQYFGDGKITGEKAGKVIFSDRAAKFGVHLLNTQWQGTSKKLYSISKCKVIGNIHQNPELVRL